MRAVIIGGSGHVGTYFAPRQTALDLLSPYPLEVLRRMKGNWWKTP